MRTGICSVHWSRCRDGSNDNQKSKFIWSTPDGSGKIKFCNSIDLAQIFVTEFHLPNAGRRHHMFGAHQKSRQTCGSRQLAARSISMEPPFSSCFRGALLCPDATGDAPFGAAGYFRSPEAMVPRHMMHSAFGQILRSGHGVGWAIAGTRGDSPADGDPEF